MEAPRDVPSTQQYPFNFTGQQPEETAHRSFQFTCTLEDREKRKRAAAVRWTSAFQDTAVKTSGGKHCTGVPSVNEPPSPKINSLHVVAASNDTTKAIASGDGPLSLESLLHESQQQLSALLWQKRRCRTLQAALDASLERQKVLENALVESSGESQETREQYRAYVATTAEELRQTRKSLRASETALRVMEDEVGGLRRENERLRQLHKQAEEDHTVRRRQQKRMEDQLSCLLAEKERIQGELSTSRARCRELETLQTAKETTIDASAESNDETKNMNKKKIIHGNDDNGGGDAARRDEINTIITLLEDELDRRHAEMGAMKESTEAFREEMRQVVGMACKRLTVVSQRGAQLTSVLACDGKQLQRGMEEDVENGGDMDSLFATLAIIVRRLEQQWCCLEERVMSRESESQEKQKELQNQLDAMKEAHLAELQTIKSTRQEATERLHQMEIRYTQLLRAMERQSQMVLTATNTDMRISRGNKTSRTKEKPRNKQEDGDKNSDDSSSNNSSHEEYIEGRGEERGKRMACEKETFQTYEWHFGRKEFMTCETILDPSHDRMVYTLLRRTRQATRNAIRQLREARSKHDTLLKLQEEKQRQSMAISEERVRYQAIVKRLQTSLKTAHDTESSLKTKIAAIMRTAEVERNSLVRRAEAAERDVQAKSKQERLLQRQVREMQEQYEAAKQELTARDDKIAELSAELAEGQSTTREKQFDLNTLHHRCEDLVRMTDVLETRVRREIRNQDVFYELLRKLCGAVAVLTLRLSTVAEERDALWRAYEARETDCRAAIQVLQEFMKKEEEEGQELELGLHKIGRVLPSHHGRSFYVVVAVVIACHRMQHLLSFRHSRRHVMFAVYNEDDNSTNLRNNGRDLSGFALSPWHMLKSRNVLSLVASVPRVSAALRWQTGGTRMPFVHLPPLKTLLSVIASRDGNGTAEHEVNDTLEKILALAELDNNMETNRFWLEAHISRGAASAAAAAGGGGGAAWTRRGLPCVNSQPIHCRGMLAEKLHYVLHTVRDAATEFRQKMRQKDASIQIAEEESHQLRSMVQEREGIAAGFAQQLREYEEHVATAFVSRDFYQELQDRLRAAHDALQEEREARRKIEEVNAALRQREIELTRIVQLLRDEVRSLSIELAEQASHDDSHCQRIDGYLSTLRLSPSRRKTMNTSRESNKTQLYVPRSVKLTSLPFTAISSMNTHENTNNEDGGKLDEAVRQVLSGLASRLEQAEGNPLQP
ncbi:Basal body protein [Trypanosoma cruzi]|uniref:Basal body protein n=1 Tax=Trypanosoma cruzi TaxID=5693 RepID=A0A7J6YIU6_TRYCR|nr:Basal body protein [Trypanosoma cruzi]